MTDTGSSVERRGIGRTKMIWLRNMRQWTEIHDVQSQIHRKNRKAMENVHWKHPLVDLYWKKKNEVYAHKTEARVMFAAYIQIPDNSKSLPLLKKLSTFLFSMFDNAHTP